MKTQYTPGPWKVIKNYKYYYYNVVDNDGYSIGCINEKEDATLIAAAPELLSALKLCQVRIFMLEGSENEVYRAATAAIAAAEGRE